MKHHSKVIQVNWLIIKVILLVGSCLGTSSCAPVIYEIPEVEGPSEFLGMFVNGKKVGYLEQSRVVESDRVITTIKEVAWFDRFAQGLGERIAYTKHIESFYGEPIAFEHVENKSTQSSFFCAKKSTKLEGVIAENGKMRITKTRNGKSRNFEIEWPEKMVLSEGLRLSFEDTDLKEGETFSGYEIFQYNPIRVFHYNGRVGKTKRMSYLGGEDILTEITVSGNTQYFGEVLMFFYVDKDLNIRKVVAKYGGLELQAFSCSREFALSRTDLFELRFGGQTLVE